MKFSLNWFKRKKEEQDPLYDLMVEEQGLKNDLLKLKMQRIEQAKTVEQPVPVVAPIANEKPYKKVTLVNDVLTIVFNDGSVLCRQGATKEDFIGVKLAKSESEILNVITEDEIQEYLDKEEDEEIGDKIKLLVETGEFETEGGAVYMKGIDRSLPKLLIQHFAGIVDLYEDAEEYIMTYLNEDREYQSLKKFWVKCCLNPNAQSAEDLYEFLSHHQFKIDRHGNFYAYRRVVSKNNAVDKSLVDAISNTYTKIRAMWKQNPAKFELYQEGDEYQIHRVSKCNTVYPGELVGNIDALYRNLPNMSCNVYTAAHDNRMDYRVGEIISMPRQMGDDNNQVSCSKGYHVASDKYDYSGFGDTPILTIVNPMDVLAVPVGEVGKLRTCRWFFACTLPENEKYILDDKDFDVESLGDVFEEKCMENVETYVHSRFAEEVQRHTFNVPSMSDKDIHNLTSMLETINKRIKEIL